MKISRTFPEMEFEIEIGMCKSDRIMRVDSQGSGNIIGNKVGIKREQNKRIQTNDSIWNGRMGESLQNHGKKRPGKRL